MFNKKNTFFLTLFLITSIQILLYINNTQKRIIVCLKNIQSKKLKSIYEKVVIINE